MQACFTTGIGLVALMLALPAVGSEAAPVVLPNRIELAAVDFDRHVASLLGRLGCNAGSCHGSFQGRGGLNLSLFGHDPAHDFQALTRDALGRRVDVLDPDRSLMLRKATGLVPHEGGQRFPPGSWEYQVIRAWIAAGARRDPVRPAAERIKLHPRELFFDRPGDSAPLVVVARFADGSEADVTAFCEIRTRDDTIATCTNAGHVRGLKPGDTVVVATYRGLLAAARVIVPTGRAVCVPEVPETDIVDRAINDKLRALGLEPSAPASDAEFLRRVTLDVTGSLPAPDDVRAFVADPSPDKRSRKIDELLDHPRHAALWATRYLDITGCDVAALEGPPELRSQRARMWHDWFRKRFANNMPYDRIAHDILCATSRDGNDVRTWLERETARLSAAQTQVGRTTDYAAKPGLDLFWRRFSGDSYFPVEQMAERTAAAFLGVRIECAQCHKHPFDRWTQTDYRGFANVFALVEFGLSPEALAAAAELLEERRRSDPGGALPPTPRLREVYTRAHPSRRLADPATGRPLAPRALGGPELDAAERDPRESLFAWLTTPDNPYFARSFVNRVWAVYFGAGLVEPVDGFSVANPPSNPRLLDALATDFVAHGYDIRRLERTILNSRAYQRSSAPTEGNLDDHGNFARAQPRPLMAEVLVDALNDALGVPGEFGPDAPPGAGARAIEIATNRVKSPDLARAFRIFGRPRRTAVCDCERPREPAVPQTLFLMTDSGLLAKIKSGRLRGLLESGRPDAEIVEELFLATLSRAPDGDECQAALDHVRGGSDRDREGAFVDILWALINTREFILNH